MPIAKSIQIPDRTNIMSSPFIAEIVMFGGNFNPRGWALCDGQLLNISSHTALFSLLGTTYGGDGRTTFALPDLRGRVPVHPGSGPGLSPRRLGEKGGSETNTLSVNQLPSHFHAAGGLKMQGNTNGSSTEDPSDASLCEADSNVYNGNAPDAPMAANTVVGDTAATGGGQSVNNMQPFLGINFIIALTGVFPSRN